MRILLTALLLAGCQKEAPPAPSPVATALARLSPAEPVDAAFKGCEAGCGKRGLDSNAHLQPGAGVGDLAYCAVSGVVFRVTEASPRADLDGKPLFFCCENCRQHYLANREAVITARGF